MRNRRRWVSKKRKRLNKTRNRRRTRRGGNLDNLERAHQFLEEAKQKQPEITRALKKASTNLGGATLIDGYMFKSADSIARKLSAKEKERGGESYIPRDVLRYTYKIKVNPYKPNDFYEIIQAIHLILSRKGNDIIPDPENAKNSFCKGNIYKGLNKTFLYDKYAFEIQFHTEQSLDMKTRLHKDYEEYRTTKDQHTKCTLKKKMQKANDEIKTTLEADKQNYVPSCEKIPEISDCPVSESKDESNDDYRENQYRAEGKDSDDWSEGKDSDDRPRAEGKDVGDNRPRRTEDKYVSDAKAQSK